MLLEVNNVSKVFPVEQGLMRKATGYVHAVTDVSFMIDKGQAFVRKNNYSTDDFAFDNSNRRRDKVLEETNSQIFKP